MSAFVSSIFTALWIEQGEFDKREAEFRKERAISEAMFDCSHLENMGYETKVKWDDNYGCLVSRGDHWEAATLKKREQ